MDEVQDIKKKLAHLEYDEINPLKEQVNEIKISLSNNDLLTKQIMDSNKKLSDSMDTFKTTMVDITNSIKDSNRVSSQLADTVEQLNNKISSVDKSTKESIDAFGEKLDEIDNKSKFDILLWTKNNFVAILGIGGLIYTIITQVLNK